MEYLEIKKWKTPTYVWTYQKNPFVFDMESLNFNTVIYAFTNNNLQRRYLESKLCEYFRVENWDVRFIDAYPGEDIKDFLKKVWWMAQEIMSELIH